MLYTRSGERIEFWAIHIAQIVFVEEQGRLRAYSA